MLAKSDRADTDEVNSNVPTSKQESSKARANRNGTKDTTIIFEARVLARAYAIQEREDATASDVIVGIFYLFDVTVCALIDPRSTEFDAQVKNPLGQSAIVNLICSKCPLRIQGYDFPTDLMLLPFREFVIIFGMGWLTLHNIVVNYRLKRVDLTCQTGEMITVESDRSNSITRELNFDQVPILNEFTNMFPEELPGLPPKCEVEFVIDLMPEIVSISIAPYRMTPTELKELKAQLQELSN
ncbi:uncharacterized protein LOC105789566 [Gossypium raimondii]|uniref:uncharacterized protein LOC105789566 n=1 Tax=Gossypium raimondii TaxID=29730 RepID=UPI00063AA122|nr:uncharacterized protein LOC105789566 [Gossypium raimondii]